MGSISLSRSGTRTGGKQEDHGVRDCRQRASPLSWCPASPPLSDFIVLTQVEVDDDGAEGPRSLTRAVLRIDTQVKERTQSKDKEASEVCKGEEGDCVTETCVQDPAQAIYIPRGTAGRERTGCLNCCKERAVLNCALRMMFARRL